MTTSIQVARRRALLRTGVAAAVGGLASPLLRAQAAAPVRIGFMLPYSGTFAQIGRAIDNGFWEMSSDAAGNAAATANRPTSTANMRSLAFRNAALARTPERDDGFDGMDSSVIAHLT